MIAIVAWQQWSALSDMQIWLKLISEKYTLMEREANYVHHWRAAHLDALHEDIEYQLRCIIENPGETALTLQLFVVFQNRNAYQTKKNTKPVYYKCWLTSLNARGRGD